MPDIPSFTAPPSPKPIARLAVFCGASNGARAEYPAAAAAVGSELARRGITLVYGGGRAGLMGAVADAAIEQGGKAIGVITKLLESRELGHAGITELRVVETMHERKMMMADLADAFIVLPGGLGTLDEMFEILAWAQLGIHSKPVGLMNALGFYDQLWSFLDHLDREQFLRINHRTRVVLDDDAGRLIDKLRAG